MTRDQVSWVISITSVGFVVHIIFLIYINSSLMPALIVLLRIKYYRKLKTAIQVMAAM